MTILLLRCLSCIVFYSETLKLNTLLIYSYYNYIDMHIYFLVVLSAIVEDLLL